MCPTNHSLYRRTIQSVCKCQLVTLENERNKISCLFIFFLFHLLFLGLQFMQLLHESCNTTRYSHSVHTMHQIVHSKKYCLRDETSKPMKCIAFYKHFWICVLKFSLLLIWWTILQSNENRHVTRNHKK